MLLYFVALIVQLFQLDPDISILMRMSRLKSLHHQSQSFILDFNILGRHVSFAYSVISSNHLNPLECTEKESCSSTVQDVMHMATTIARQRYSVSFTLDVSVCNIPIEN